MKNQEAVVKIKVEFWLIVEKCMIRLFNQDQDLVQDTIKTMIPFLDDEIYQRDPLEVAYEISPISQEEDLGSFLDDSLRYEYKLILQAYGW